jgi:hypothetical protein
VYTDNGKLQERRSFMELILDTKEQEILTSALTSAISDLGPEIAHTEKYELRQELKERKNVLREILGRLSGNDQNQ